ncbi:hypothetical protein KSC_026720 [Ktedonobacter sp. SOSP1-52]|uniref:hypothetical protein n=1 Tax=Ktedonobacter sp. SOSP1-52 TaxID=2778366 RepID=UPI00191605F0|nr:hypothetical protein [Ktedonobacter sp. SOSP1-52]GHO63780.1 hypothetical protein KSC_026720 [Ktedonobacter sp. SOSP1-52]
MLSPQTCRSQNQGKPGDKRRIEGGKRGGESLLESGSIPWEVAGSGFCSDQSILAVSSKRASERVSVRPR